MRLVAEAPTVPAPHQTPSAATEPIAEETEIRSDVVNQEAMTDAADVASLPPTAESPPGAQWNDCQAENADGEISPEIRPAPGDSQASAG